MKNKDKYRESLKEYLLQLDVAQFTTDQREILTRCPYCGDSQKNQYKGHMYVFVAFNDNESPVFYCQKCKTSGFVNRKFLELLSLDTNELLTLQKEHNSMLTKKFGVTAFKNKEIKDLIIPNPRNNQHTIDKIKYFEKRMGIKITKKTIKEYKIIFSIFDFLKENKIEKITRHEKVIENLEENYIGFLSYDKNYISFRNIYNEKIDDKFNRRYILYNIFNAYDNTKRFYTISNELDLMKNVEFIMSEGIFDIVSIHKNIYKQDSKNKLFMAVCGSGYESVIKYFMSKGFIHCDIKIYADKDQEINLYRELKKSLGNRLHGSIEVIYNKKSKDFGVKPENIEMHKILI